MYDARFTREARKDAVDIGRAELRPKVNKIIKTVQSNPYEDSQGFEKLVGDYKGAYSRRINRKHRFVYEVLPNTENLKDASGTPYTGIVKILSMWTHYE